MKLPSIDYLIRNTKSSLLRFPWVLAVACAATGVGIWFNEIPYGASHHDRVGHFLMALYLGISLCFGLSMLLERIRLPRTIEAVVFVPVLSLLGLYAYSMEGQPEFVVGARYSLYLLASHVFVAVAPYLRRGYSRGFWEYNHRLLLRIIVSGIFTGCLYLGIVAAMAAIDHLFEVTVSNKAYVRIFLLASGIFNTWFFLAGVPGDFEDLDRDHPYPRVIQVLTQYILVPLVTLYLVILYSYAFKIVMDWEWPVGWVSYLVLICSLLGILSLLLVHPIQELRENQWIKAFSRYFYFILFPLLVLLFASIGRRISEYRLTENRYFVLVLAIWLTGIALYFTFSRVRNIKVVPVSLGLLALLASFGPWGAFQVARHSQVERLREMLQTRNLLKEGKLARTSALITKETEAQIGSVVEFLEDRNLLKTLRAWPPDSALADPDTQVITRHTFLKQMGLKYIQVDRYGNVHVNNTSHFYIRDGQSRRITGFDYHLVGEQNGSRDTSFTLIPGPDRCEANFISDSSRVRITVGGVALMEFKLWPLLDSIHQTHPGPWIEKLPPEMLYRELEGGGYKVGLQVQKVFVERDKGRSESLTATIFVKVPVKSSP